MTAEASITPPKATDAHEYTAEMLYKQAGICRAVFFQHITEGLLERGAVRQGQAHRRFWTRTQANKWLRRIGKRDRQFER